MSYTDVDAQTERLDMAGKTIEAAKFRRNTLGVSLAEAWAWIKGRRMFRHEMVHGTYLPDGRFACPHCGEYLRSENGVVVHNDNPHPLEFSPGSALSEKRNV